MQQINRAQLVHTLEKMDSNADSAQTICVIGAAAILLLGHNARQTVDIDVWRAASTFIDPELKAITIAAGIGFDPRNDRPSGAYLQIIDPGIVNLPAMQGDVWPGGHQSRVLWQGQHLKVVCPPPAILAASKLIRASDVDLEDVIYLMAQQRLSRQQIADAAQSFEGMDRQTITENLTILDVMRG